MQHSLVNTNGHAHISGGQFTNVNNYGLGSGGQDGFKRLHVQAAFTALHNALYSVKSGKCHPNTRTRVLDELFQFIGEDWETRKTWILWLSGPAGSGKTTITKTLAYLCDDRNIDKATFFFCRLDPSRNGIRPLVATLAYQIACQFPSVKEIIVAVIEQMPHIFDLSVAEQFQRLVISPLNEAGWSQDFNKTRPYPIVCVIDALDECEESRDKAGQSEVFQVLEQLVSRKNSPVIFMLSSRPETKLIMSFNRISHSISRIYLDTEYNPSDDIRRFVRDEFKQIGTIHPFASSLPQDWPDTTAIDAIVAKSSGQFVYAATVMNYISSPDSDPEESLNYILNPLSTEPSSMPFDDLDNLFSSILRQATPWSIVSTVIACHLLSLDNEESSASRFSSLLELHNLSVKSIRRYILKIASLARLDDDGQQLVLYHASLVDFLTTHKRSGNLYIDIGRVSYSTLMTTLRNPRDGPDVYLKVVDAIITLLPKAVSHLEEMESLERLLFQFAQEVVTMHPESFLVHHGRREVLIDAFLNSNIHDYNKNKFLKIWLEWSEKEINALSDRGRLVLESGFGRNFDFNKRFPNFKTTPPPLLPEAAARFKKELCNVDDLMPVKQLLALFSISKATGILFSAISDLLGYDNATCARVLSALPSILDYDIDQQIIKADHLETLLDWLESPAIHDLPDLYHLDISDFRIQLAIQMLSSSDSYQGNLFGDIGGLLCTIEILDPDSDKLSSHLIKISQLLLVSKVNVHVLDFTAFLEGLVHAYCKKFWIYNGTVSEFWSYSCPPPYIRILKYLARFWASRNRQLDAQLLGIPKFSEIWQQLM